MNIENKKGERFSPCLAPLSQFKKSDDTIHFQD